MPQPRHAILFAGCWVASLCATVNAECSLHCPPAMLDVYSLFVALKGLNDNQTGIAVAEVEEKTLRRGIY